MRIMIVVHNLAGAGAQRSAVNLANGFAKKGNDVRIVALTSGGNMAKHINHDVSYQVLGSSRVAYSIFKLTSEVKSYMPDIVLCTPRHVALMTCIASKVFRWNSLVFVREAESLEASRKLAKNLKVTIQHIILPAFYQLADGVIVISNGMQSEMQKVLPAKMRERIVAINNPALLPSQERNIFDIDEKSNVKLDQDAEISSNKNKPWNIIAIGRLHKQKGFDILIKSIPAVLEKYSQMTLEIYGDGPEKNSLESIIKSLNLEGRVKLCGWSEDPFRDASSVDLFVLSSRWEGFGNVVVEALSHGVPCVVTNCMYGPSEIINSNDIGIVAKANDPIDLADKVNDALRDYRKFNKSSIRKRSLDFAADKKCDEYLNFFKNHM